MIVEAWIPLTIAAAFLQNLRSMLQKRATEALSTNGASYIRFCYALPFVWLYLGALLLENPLPAFTASFAAYCVVAAVAQIVSTGLLIASFSHGNFALGTTYSKTEVAQTALVGLVVLGDTLSLAAVGGILVSFLGVVTLSVRVRLGTLVRGDRALLLGLLAGTGLAVASVGYRGASLSLGSGDFLLRAATTLAVAVTLQTLILGVYLRVKEPGELGRVAANWRAGIWVGLVGGAASAGWFTAMTLVNAGLVRALGQVELLFTFAASAWFFRERVTRRDVVGALLIVAGILLLLI